MQLLQSPRGTRDILPEQQPVWQFCLDTARKVAEQMGYLPISTPTYEEIALFERSIGEGTDVIDKELFLVRGRKSEEESYALRPEGTAGLVRSYLEHGMRTWPQPVKLYTILNCFRYERPQKGRYREHFQFDFEYFGEKGAFADAWVIYTGWRFYQALGLKNIGLSLNTLGAATERAAYSQKLVAYFTPLKQQLSQDSQDRLAKNPLRILDSKDPIDQEKKQGAPILLESIGEESKRHFQEVQNYLKTWKIPFEINPHLIRGLDYYSHTTFEWVARGREGSQDSLGGGGRYDGLLTILGGQDGGAVGTGIGLDRTVEEIISQGLAENFHLLAPQIVVLSGDHGIHSQAQEVIEELYQQGFWLDTYLGKESLASQMKSAGRSGARFALIIGADEATANQIAVKDLRSGKQELVPRSDLIRHLRVQFAHA